MLTDRQSRARHNENRIKAYARVYSKTQELFQVCFPSIHLITSPIWSSHHLEGIEFRRWQKTYNLREVDMLRDLQRGIPGWRSGLEPAFGSGRDPGDPGSNPTSGSRCMEPASPSACVSASLSFSLCDYNK